MSLLRQLLKLENSARNVSVHTNDSLLIGCLHDEANMKQMY